MEEINDVHHTWIALCNTYTRDSDNLETIYTEIVTSYREPHRFYHILSHVRDLVSLIQECGEVEGKAMLLFTAFFHDVVYNPGSSSNEKESAAIARAAMEQLAVPQLLIEDTAHLILLTKAHADVDKSVVRPDMLMFLDMDLSILGAEPSRYKRYAADIRKEFRKFPHVLYNNGRRNFLEGQLKLPVIFHTEFFREKFEQQARINMVHELNSLL